MNDLIPIVPLMIPIIALAIPIVAILTAHQRKMAEFHVHRQPQQNPLVEQEIASLRQEVRELRQLVNEQALALDDARRVTMGLSAGLRQTPPNPETISQRLNG